MKTLGIDLASQPGKTAACLLEWKDKSPRIVSIDRPCTDDQLDELAAQADAVGVDAPFGWPVKFREAVQQWPHSRWDDSLRDDLTLRLTDRRVTTLVEKHPLRVSADRIAIPAMRAMALLHRHEVTDHSGPANGKFFEVYPAASLKAWGLLPKSSYKTDKNDGPSNREKILAALCKRFAFRAEQNIAESDHKLDALIAAITARLAKTGGTSQPEPNIIHKVRREGWIHVPTDGQ